MKSYQFSLLCRQFSYISEVVARLNRDEVGKPGYLDGIQVRPADAALMARTPTFDSWASAAGWHHNFDSFFAVVKDGEEFRLYKLDEEGESGTPQGYDSYVAENIGDQLFALGVKPDFLVEVVQNDTDDYGNGSLSRYMVIYKVASRYDLAGYHARQIDKAAAELKAELAASFK
jgi:hypothetical protein